MEKRYNRIIFLLMFFTIVFTIAGSTLAYWNWQTSEDQKTTVTFTVTKDFECAADGGGSITSGDAFIAPTSCTNSTHAIQREVTIMPTIYRNNLTINMNLYLDVNSLDTGLSNSQNFRYALTTSSTSCEEGVISSGNLHGLTTGSKVEILNKNYSSSTPQKYYLYIWLDKVETSASTMDQRFNLSISGSCTDNENGSNSLIQAPILDSGMIPVTIANNGTVTTISSDDENWYNYENKEWANVVLVNETSRSTYKNTTGVTVNQDDILAYYVWIPRYAYKISTSPGFMTKADKDALVDELVEAFGGLLIKSQVNEAIENGVKTGIVSGIGTNDVSMVDLIDEYNTLKDPDIIYRTYVPMSEEDIVSLTNILVSIARDYNVTYTAEQARIDVDNGVLNGVFSSSIVGNLVSILLGTDKVPMNILVSEINSELGTNLVYNSIGTMSEDDKEMLINITVMLASEYGIEGYTEDDALLDVESGISTGTFSSAALGPLFSAELGVEEMTMSEYVTIINVVTSSSLAYSENKSNGNNIDIKFEKKGDNPTLGNAVDTYLSHPAFWWDDNNNNSIENSEILGGIWVGKFSNTGDNSSTTILPNKNQYSGAIRYSFENSLKFAGGTLSNGVVTFAGSSIYGLTSSIDSHMMKNSEWGAVVYLAYSEYGINKDVKVNMASSGCGVNSIIVAGQVNPNTCEFMYGGANNYPQSTTGNITGIFDMSTLYGTYVMGVISDVNGNPLTGNGMNSSNSGFNGLTGSGSEYTSGIPFPEKKYYDLYLQSQFNGDSQTNMSFCTLDTCAGHALYETKGWYTGGMYSFPVKNAPWFVRGLAMGNINDEIYTSMFSLSVGPGHAWDSYYFSKTVLINK